MSTKKSVIPHYCVSIARLAEANPDRRKADRMGAAHVAVLHILWCHVSNPFADRPTVYASYDYLSMMLNSSPGYVQHLTRDLARAGALVKGQSRKGQGTAYTLLRPEHAPEDMALGPRLPRTQEELQSAVLAAAKALQADGLFVSPRTSLKAKPRLPAIKPSNVAIMLEDAAGYPKVYKEHKGKQVRKPALPYSAKCGDWSAVKAACLYLNDHSAAEFKQVCEAAAKAGAFAETKEQRARLFEDPELVARLLKSADKPKLVKDCDPAVVFKGLTKLNPQTAVEYLPLCMASELTANELSARCRQLDVDKPHADLSKLLLQEVGQ